jgi:hypothetical protein
VSPANASIRIDDLIDPQLTDDQRAALEFTATFDISFDEAELVAESQARTQLSDFGDDAFRTRLRAHLAAIDGDRGLTNLGRLILRRRVLRLLSSRLLLTDLVARYPEIHDVQIERPLIVVGLPRSGTTHLVNLLAADTRFRSLPYWESQEPFPLPGEGPDVDGIDPRWRRCAEDHAVEATMAPLTKNMHDRFPAAIEEEVELLDVDFASYTLEWHARVPDWREYYLSLDQREHYAYLKTMLKALTFLRGPRRWVLKSPQHLEQIGPLVDTFPDATIAFTHRDPVAVIQSAITMLAYGDRLRRHQIEPEQLAEYWVDRVERLLRACVRDRELVPEDRSVDVVFHEFMADDMATIERIHHTAGKSSSDGARAQLETYRRENPRGKHGQVLYDLAGDFGMKPDDVRARFDFYFDRFAIEAED